MIKMVGFTTATTNLNDAITKLLDVYFNTTFNDTTWAMTAIFIFGSLLLITREWNEWGTLALPVMIGWKYFGMPVPYAFVAIGVILFVVNGLTINTISKTLSITGESVSNLLTRTGRQRINLGLQRNKLERVNIEERMREMSKDLKPDYRTNLEKLKDKDRTIKGLSADAVQEEIEKAALRRQYSQGEWEKVKMSTPDEIKEYLFKESEWRKKKKQDEAKEESNY